MSHSLPPDSRTMHASPGQAFLSGMGRSGTTLLDKLLCNHPSLSVLSQPFPYLFLHAKRVFLATLGEPDCPRPLGVLFRERRYDLEDLTRFLDQFEVTPEELRQLFAAMADYDGQYHKPPDLEHTVARLPGGRFLDTFEQLLRALRHREEAACFASKETHCEEFFPFFANRNVRCLHLIRDPRDVIASFHFGEGGRYGGRRRPTLFYVRNWRKSVAIRLLLERHVGYHWLRYEDLVSDPRERLRAITDFLEVAPLPEHYWRRPLRAQDGQVWRGNSSHAPSGLLNRQSIGRFREILPPDMRRYIEICCWPEMRLLGYPDIGPPPSDGRELDDFVEPFVIERDDFAADYSTCQRHLREERQRWRLLMQPELPDDERFFLTPSVRDRLREAAA